MIIVLAGTSEGREICSLLKASGQEVMASVTSAWGQDLLEQQGCPHIWQGQLTLESMMNLIKDTGACRMIDATHPFASAVSQVAITAAQQTGIDYLRLERPTIKLPDDPLVIGITDLARLEDYVLPGQRVFSTLGSKYLATIMPIIRRKQADLIARVLPSSTVLKNCEELGLHPNQLIAMQGPFSMNLNLELFRQYSADLIISKESGVLGGLEAKIGAALKLGLRILVWSRPVINYPRCFDSSQSLMEYINSEERDVR